MSNGDVRLVGGSSQYEGHVEVYYSGGWRSACYSGWNQEASSVVCKQLGYGLVAGVTSTSTGSSSDSVSVYCNGFENSLTECSISSYSYGCYSKAVVGCTNSSEHQLCLSVCVCVCACVRACVCVTVCM